MASALETLYEYYNAFSTLDVTAIVPYFCETSITLAPQGIFAAPTRAALADSLGPIIAGLKAKGYGHSEFVEPQVTMLSNTVALVRGVAVRYTAAGRELQRVPLSYVMHRAEGGWEIAVLVIAG